MKSTVKALIIAFIFIGSLAGLMELKGAAMSGRKLHKMIFIESGDDWGKCSLKRCRVDNQSLILLTGAEGSQLISDPITPGFPFDELILSWNANYPDSGVVFKTVVEVSEDSGKWYKFDYQNWGPLSGYDSSGVEVKDIEGIGRMQTDFLVLEKPMKYAKVIVAVKGPAGTPDIVLRRISLSFSAKNSSWDDYRKYHPENPAPRYGSTKLAVPYITQRNLPSELSGNCCSPTSCSMVLNYYGKEIDPEKFAHMVYDPRAQMYGNWPHNVAAAFVAGMGKTWVESHCSFDELYGEVAGGRPVVISIAYGYDELPHSPIHEAPEGHLIVIVGFDGPNVVICNDPAGHTPEDGIIRYPRKELEHVWLAHRGIAYHLWLD